LPRIRADIREYSRENKFRRSRYSAEERRDWFGRRIAASAIGRPRAARAPFGLWPSG